MVALKTWRKFWLERRVELTIKGDNVGALTAISKLKSTSAALRICASETALMIAEGTFAPDVVEHIPGVANVIPDLLSRMCEPRLQVTRALPLALQEATRSSLDVRDQAFWRTLDTPTGEAKME